MKVNVRNSSLLVGRASPHDVLWASGDARPTKRNETSSELGVISRWETMQSDSGRVGSAHQSSAERQELC
jgi:hypothetical protein